MATTVTLQFTEADVRTAVNCYWKRTVGVTFVAAIVFLIAVFFWRAAEGDRSWVIGMLGAFLLLVVVVVAAAYVAPYRQSLAAFRALDPPEATMTLDEATLSIASSVGSSTVAWSAVKELWRFDGVWLLLFSKAQFVTLPVRCLSPEAQALISEKVRSAGGRVA
jgi:hypothetical protein